MLEQTKEEIIQEERIRIYNRITKEFEKQKYIYCTFNVIKLLIFDITEKDL